MEKKISLAIIGCGNIANFHVKAFRSLGLKINHCASSLNSKKVSNFAQKYNIQHVWKDPIELAKSSRSWDAIILTSTTESTPKILDILINHKKPILVEKPVSMGTKYLKKFSANYPKFVNVAYNRRFYSTVQKAKEFVNKCNGQLLCSMKMPGFVKKSKNHLISFRNIYENSCHGIDILRYIFGDLKIINNSKIKLNSFDSGRITLLKSKKNHLCNVIMNSNSPDNFSFEIENGNERLLLKPFESFELYKGIDFVRPNKKYPLKSYKPRLIERNNVFSNSKIKFKPGFLEQSKDFLKLIKGKTQIKSAKLIDAYKTQHLLEKIMLS